MRIVTNKKLARRNRKITNYLFFGTFGALILGFFVINSSLFTGEAPDVLTLMLQTAILPAAFVLTVISVRMTNLWARRPRPEQAIADGLKGLSGKSVLYNYHHFPARHVLICPQGVYAMITRWHDYEFTVRDGRFHSQRGLISRLFSAIRFDGIGRPFRDAEDARQRVQAMMNDIDADVEVQALIVFVDPAARVNMEDEPETPVLFADPKQKPNLTDYMRGVRRQIAADDSDRKNASLMPLDDLQIKAFEKATI